MDPYAELFELVGMLAHKRFRLAERELASLGLNHTEARLLSLLVEGGATTQEELSASLTVDRSNAGRALKKLESHGYVLRRRDRADKRTNIVAPTRSGRSVAVRVSRVREKLVRKLFRGLEAQEAKVVVRLLGKVAIEDDRQG